MISRLLVVATLSLLTLTSRAQAAPPSPPRAEAAERFKRALRLADEHDYAGALAEFQRANELVPSRLVQANVGLVYAALGRPVEATRTLDQALAAPGQLPPDLLASAQRTRREQAARIGTITVTSNVAAVIEIEGIEAGRTPLPQALSVASGTHVVGALASGYLPSRKEVIVAGGANVAVSFELIPTEAALAHLDVRSTLPGAELLVDGAPAGRTPLPASLALAPGAHRLTLRRHGYREAERSLTLAEGATGEVVFELDPDPTLPAAELAHLAVSTSEDRAAVTIDGRPRGLTRSGASVEVALPPGAHAIQIERGGFEPASRTIDLSAGARTSVAITLRPTAETRLAYQSAAVSRRRASWIAMSTGAAFLVGGGAIALWANGSLSDARAALSKEQAAQTLMSGSLCDPSLALTADMRAACAARLQDADDRVQTRKTWRTIGLVGAGLGAAALAGGLYLRFTGEPPGRYDDLARLDLAPFLTAGGGGLGLSGRY